MLLPSKNQDCSVHRQQHLILGTYSYSVSISSDIVLEGGGIRYDKTQKIKYTYVTTYIEEDHRKNRLSQNFRCNFGKLLLLFKLVTLTFF